ncbi:gluconokinase [Microbacterium lushaniae]|uniref:Gluconokinase n=1 Tax=Microbacterium lushaniae TaxID=2614639 RepID=A0A5J6L6X2_9MICO|nr:gluconokinase, GntK/IdnK-type [Microbacterium lushaniae]QEW04217.1 AAA family ATPase [Microbacterium lushaniae]
MTAPAAIVVMGVSAAGKSSVAAALSERLGLPWADADGLHSADNVAKMAAGQPLSDDDRWPWLDAVGQALAAGAATGGMIVACSALRRSYRDRIRRHAPDAVFVHLSAPDEVLAARAAARTGHFMPTTLLASQLATLEPLGLDEPGVVVDVTPPVADVADQAARALSAGS